MKKYTIIYQVEIEARDIDEAEELAETEEVKNKARLETIESEDGEYLGKVYDFE